MSFAAKTDYAGLATTGLALRSNGDNATNQVLPIPGSDGSTLGDEVFGHVKAPTCEYAITDSVTLSAIELGKVNGSDGDYALQRVHVSTSAGGEPTFTADCVQIESGAAQTICTYAVDSLSLSPARHALTFGAFTFTESASLALQTSEFDASVVIDPTTINGDPVASDATAGVQTVTATFWTNSDATAPTVTASSGWHLTTDWACVGADSSMFVWTATFTKYLAATLASA